MTGSISPSLLEIVARRECVIKSLLEDCSDKRELEDTLDVSRTTIDRAINNLSDAGCVIYENGRWEVTLLGQLAYEEYDNLKSRYDGLTAARPLLLHLPPDTSLDIRLFADAQVFLAEPPAPHTPLNQLENLLQHCEQIKGLVSVLLPSHIPIFRHHIIDRAIDTDLILNEDLVEYLWANYSDEMRTVLETDSGMLRWLEQKPPFGLVIIDEQTVWFTVYDEDGGLKGAIINNEEDAVAWATEIFHLYRQQAEQVIIRGGSPLSNPGNSLP